MAFSRFFNNTTSEPTTLNGQWIEVFKAGRYCEKGSYSAADLDRMVANYAASGHEAPVVVGHPEHDKPAFGWVESLKRTGDTLLAKLRDVQPEFEDLVRRKLFKKRSISFYPDTMTLRHLGFLGAMPPGVKGLADVRLSELCGGHGCGRAVEFEEDNVKVTTFAADRARVIRGLTNGEIYEALFEALSAKYGLDQGLQSGGDIWEVWPDFAIITRGDDKFYKVGYQVTDGKVQLAGQLVEVEEAWIEVKPSQFSAGNPAQSFYRPPDAGSVAQPSACFSEAIRVHAQERSICFSDAKDELVALGVTEATFRNGRVGVANTAQAVRALELQRNAAAKGGTMSYADASYLAREEGQHASQPVTSPSTNRFPVDPKSVKFAEAIEKRMKERSIDYGTAMTQLTNEGWHFLD